MDRRVIISPIAEKKLQALLEYLLEEWSLKVKTNFIKRLEDYLQIIKQEPESFPESGKISGLRRCVITKQVSIYYEFNDTEIRILTFFDTRQDPGKLAKDFEK
ncbi:type II toxin-antitoxin system RelE/ParE family toxin [Salegentibacter sp. Hel_I_6]|uniref:type II toxin-antitoxin system RelE/ParE family toxin n=1 Tax=Salegentibacter sp. Hel_I_6 TaxID=1250278 RepID=UPI00056BF6AF|nr:type II toxin-antitoxin system RelE/ParE family toxin [Salegentibacter sp. Hel_I_6]